MKKILLTSFLFLTISQLAHAQWTNSGSNVYINSGFVGIGTTNPQNPLDLQRVGSANTGAILSIQGFENSASGGGYLRLIKSRGTALGSQVTTLSGDVMGTVDYMGIRLNNTLGYSARIIGYQDGAAGTNYLPDKLSFFTGSPDNSLLERMTITSSGNIGIGTAVPNAKLEVRGPLLSSGTNSNLDVTDPIRGNISYLANSGQMVIGWNRSKGSGETDFIANPGVGNPGGFAFYNYNNANVESLLMCVRGDGNVGIGVANIQNIHNKLDVNGTIHSKSVVVDMNDWSDYVFEKDYKLPSLSEVKT